MVRINRVYTKTGDGGETRLAGGQKVAKDSARIEAYGTVDELMSAIGLVRAANDAASDPDDARARVEGELRRIQNELFNLGAELATLPEDRRADTPSLAPRHALRLERDMDAMNEYLEPLQSFVLPGGGPVGAHLHLARTICRRAEREVVRLGRVEPLPAEAIRYLNRLSDWLFVAARFAARAHGEPEPIWEPEKT